MASKHFGDGVLAALGNKQPWDNPYDAPHTHERGEWDRGWWWVQNNNTCGKIRATNSCEATA